MVIILKILENVYEDFSKSHFFNNDSIFDAKRRKRKDFSYFKNNGQDGLHLAYRRWKNGLH
ncbi:MAG: hypothetical protein H6613_12505 [Ignavibacteriales bacterium]|nr:hypothetical protein [Ignavibacteriales bacterium]